MNLQDLLKLQQLSMNINKDQATKLINSAIDGLLVNAQTLIAVLTADDDDDDIERLEDESNMAPEPTLDSALKGDDYGFLKQFMEDVDVEFSDQENEIVISWDFTSSHLALSYDYVRHQITGANVSI